MTWKELLVGIPLAVVGGALLLATAAGMMFTRTDWGRERFRSFAIEQLNQAIRGEVQIDEVLEGDLLRRVSMAGVRVYEPSGEAFAAVDTLTVHYQWHDFLFGNITFRDVTLVGPVVSFRSSPDGVWNFSEIFSGTGGVVQDSLAEAAAGDGGGRRVTLQDVTIRSGDLTLKLPWRPASPGEAKTSRWHVEKTDYGWCRIFRVERLSAQLPNVRLGGERGWLFQANQLIGRATVIGEPFDIEQLRTDVEVHGDTLSFDVWQLDLTDSRLAGQGWVRLSGELQYDFALRGNPLTTADIAWLLPQLPTGVANLDLRIFSQASDMVLEGTNARWQSPGAVVRGQFGLVFPEEASGVRFDGVALDIARLDSELVQELTGWASPVPAEFSGRLNLNGRFSALDVDSDLLVRPHWSNRSSHIKARGTLLTATRLGAADLDVVFDTLQLDLVRALLPGLALQGRVRGNARLNGDLGRGLRVIFDLEQRDRDRTPTRLNGSGTVSAARGGVARVDVLARGDPLSFSTLAAYYPALPFRGDFEAEIRVRGPVDDLEVNALLKGAGDSLRVDGGLRLAGDTTRYRGEIQGWRVRLAEFREDLPRSDLDFFVEFEGQGSTLESLEAQARAEVFASFVGGVRFDSAKAALRVADRRLLVDTAVVVAEFGELSASGALGLVAEGGLDSLHLELRADSLVGLNRWLFPTYERLTPTLLAGGDGLTGEDAQPAWLEGSALASGWVVREAGRLVVRGAIEGAELSYGELAADSLRIDSLQVGRDERGLHLGGHLEASGFGLLALEFETLELRGQLEDTLLNLSFSLAKSGASASGRLWSKFGKAARTIGLDSLTVRLDGSQWQLRQPALLRLEDSGALALQGFALANAERTIDLDGSVGVDGPAAFSANLVGVDLGNFLRFLPDSVGFGGILNMQAELSGRVSDPVIEGNFDVANGRVLGVPFTSFAGTVSYRQGQLFVKADMWDRDSQLMRVEGTAPFQLTLPSFRMEVPERALDLTVEGYRIPLTFATLISEQVVQPEGHARGTLKIGGTPGDVRIEGPLTLVDGRFRVLDTGIVYENIAGDLSFDGQRMWLNDVSLTGAQGGRAVVRGTIMLSNLRNPRFDLELRARELPLYDQLDARLVASGRATLQGTYQLPRVEGDISVVSGVFFIEEIGRQSQIVDPFARQPFEILDADFGLAGAEPVRQSPFRDSLTLDLNVDVVQNTWLRSAEANVQIAGGLFVQKRPGQQEYRFDGSLNAILGDYRLFNKRFEVVEGTIDFVGTAGGNPNLRIIARYTVQTQKRPINIRLIIGGTLEEMTLSLESDEQPPIPESDLYSYLIFGRPSYELTRAREESNLLQDVTAGVPEALAGYALGSLLVGEAGIAYVDVSRVTLAGAPEAEFRAAPGPGTGFTETQVEVGWYLAPKVFMSVAQQLVGAVRASIRLEWRINQNLTLRGITEPRLAREQEGVVSNPEQAIGVFLFYGWSY